MSTTWYQNSTTPKIKFTCMEGPDMSIGMCQEGVRKRNVSEMVLGCAQNASGMCPD